MSKNTILTGGICFLLVFLLLHPAESLSCARAGMTLWLNTLIPTLLPFIILTGMLTHTGHIRKLLLPFESFFHIFPGVSIWGGYVFVLGMLCGYPMGAKITADLFHARQISKAEASYLLSFCNNTSPAFLIHYIVLGYFQNPRLIFPSVLILYGTPILLTFFFRIKKHFASSNTTDITSPFTISKIPSCSLDFCLMDSSEAIVKIGGYIILFSVILNLLQKLPISHPFYQLFLLPSLELTNGCALLNKTITAQTIPLSFPIYYSLCMGHTAFGGWCALFQTGSMINGSGLSLNSYARKKLVTALVTSLFAYLYIRST